MHRGGAQAFISSGRPLFRLYPSCSGGHMQFFTIRNTSNDRAKTALHRTAPGFTPEPSIGGVRLRTGYQMHIGQEHFERIRDDLYRLHLSGAIEVIEGKTAEGAPDVEFMRPEEIPPMEVPVRLHNPLKPEEPQIVSMPARSEDNPPPPSDLPPPPPTPDLPPVVEVPPAELPPPTPESEKNDPAPAPKTGAKKKSLM